MKSGCFFIAASFNDTVVSQNCIALSQELARRGHRVVFLTPSKKHLEDHVGNPVIYIWPSERPTRLRDARFLQRLITEFKPDCLISDGYAAQNIMLLVGTLMRVPRRLTWYHTLREQITLFKVGLSIFEQWKIGVLCLRKRLVYNLTRPYFIANSKASLQDVIAYLQLPEYRGAKFPYGLPDPVQIDGQPIISKRRKNHITCVGRLSYEKGQDVLLHAIPLIKREFPDVQFEFIGTGSQENRYIQLAQELGITTNCQFVGNIAHKEILTRLASATFSVLPSRHEAFGMVIIESLAVGTPVIASGVDGIAEIIRNEVDGFLVAPEDPQALATQVIKLLSNPELRQTMSHNARERFLDKYVQSVVAPNIAQWLEEVMVSS